jgi:CBS domain-containing protein/anti-sigma regulatory factor (Ser/Thr protein kinase)
VTSQPESKSGFTKIQELVYELKVKDAMRRNVITASPDMLMSDLRGILRDNKISGAPVVEKDHLVGVVSIEDFIEWLSDSGDDCPISEKMTTQVATLFEDEPLTRAVDMLDRTGYGRVPVLSRADNKLVGMMTKGDIIEALLRELEVDYQEEEVRRYRASHIFEDISGGDTKLTFRSCVKARDFDGAGEASSSLKKTLERLGIHPAIVRRAAIASYEAEMNLVIYSEGGEITAEVRPDLIRLDVCDTGPGIEDVEQAVQPGYSTATEWVRELGFGAGMGLVNMKKCADEMYLDSEMGKGTHLTMSFNMKKDDDNDVD